MTYQEMTSLESGTKVRFRNAHGDDNYSWYSKWIDGVVRCLQTHNLPFVDYLDISIDGNYEFVASKSGGSPAGTQSGGFPHLIEYRSELSRIDELLASK